jgi:hypothetical protein
MVQGRARHTMIPVPIHTISISNFFEKLINKGELGLFCRKTFFDVGGGRLRSTELTVRGVLTGEKGRVVEEHKTVVSFGD